MKLKLADQATALLPLTPAGITAALVILAALREYFELLRDRATPLTGPRPRSPAPTSPPPPRARSWSSWPWAWATAPSRTASASAPRPSAATSRP
jgi:hypothetical protein